MRTKLLIPLLTVLFSVFLLVSCHKSKELPVSKATVTITEPAENAIYNNGDTVFIKGEMTNDEILHGYTVYVRNKETTAILFELKEHSHNKTLNANTFWVNTLSDSTNLEVELSVSVDHSGNSVSKKVAIQCIP